MNESGGRMMSLALGTRHKETLIFFNLVPGRKGDVRE